MTSIETEIKKTDFRNLELKIGGTISIKGKDEIVAETTVTETYLGGRKLVRFRTIRREENDGIAESGYSVDSQTGEEHMDYSGIYHEKENPPYAASKLYSELNNFLEGLGK